jgi:mRNA-degrading endonuclease toxin of MazEF toxin-antitoxin module
VVVSHDGFNVVEAWRSIIVVPLSTSPSQARRGPTTVSLPRGTGGLRRQSVALCHQVTTLDREKLSVRIGAVPRAYLDQIGLGLKVAMDLLEGVNA